MTTHDRLGLARPLPMEFDHPAQFSGSQRRKNNRYGLRESEFNGVLYFKCPHCPAEFINVSEANRHCAPIDEDKRCRSRNRKPH